MTYRRVELPNRHSYVGRQVENYLTCLSSVASVGGPLMRLESGSTHLFLSFQMPPVCPQAGRADTLNFTANFRSFSIQQAYLLFELFHYVSNLQEKYIGITGNEEADVAAKEATRHPTSMPNLKVPHHDFQTYIKHTVNKQWKLQWSSTSTSKLHEVRPGPTHTQLPKDITRRDQVVLTRLRIGHTRITHSHILNHEPQPSCDQCHTNLTVRQILVECPRYDEQRRKYHVPEYMSTALSVTIRSENVLKFTKEIKLYEHI
ncbi:hypothetical protein C0J52_14064 [Blattella germanica]|nr:hypothetical protein C0J52_14064 [Blattella germanica]